MDFTLLFLDKSKLLFRQGEASYCYSQKEVRLNYSYDTVLWMEIVFVYLVLFLPSINEINNRKPFINGREHYLAVFLVTRAMYFLLTLNFPETTHF